MRKKLTALFLSLVLLGLTACQQPTAPTEPTQEQPASLQGMYDGFMDAVSPDFAYDIALELTTNPKYFNSALGGRNAGSDAEHATADYLAGVMAEIGLTDVEKTAASCDRWQFNGASFTVDGKEYPVYSYATASTPTEGITAELVYAGKGNHVGLPGAGRDRKNCPHRHRPAGRLVDYLSHAGGRASRCCGSPGSKRGRLCPNCR